MYSLTDLTITSLTQNSPTNRPPLGRVFFLVAWPSHALRFRRRRVRHVNKAATSFTPTHSWVITRSSANTTGSGNTASGANALQNNTTGNFNTANGNNALQNNTTGDGNTATGAHCASKQHHRQLQHGQRYMVRSLHNTTGDNNTANGSFALSATPPASITRPGLFCAL